MDRQVELMTLERLERRRGETWQGLWLAPLLTIVAQAFLLLVLADETVGWLARAAVLAAALCSCLAAIWSLLRAHAREVQYSEAIDAELAATAQGDYADVRPASLSRPRRRRPRSAIAAAPVPEPPEPSEAETEVEKQTADQPEAAAEAGPEPEDETEVIEPPTPAPLPPPRAKDEDTEPREDWVSRWDRHLTWWASGESHAKAYMAWGATLALFMLADVAAYLATI